MIQALRRVNGVGRRRAIGVAIGVVTSVAAAMGVALSLLLAASPVLAQTDADEVPITGTDNQTPAGNSAVPSQPAQNPPAHRAGRRRTSRGPASESSEYPRFTFDLGVAAGSYNGESYTEGELGLNTFFRSWIDWRNAFFARFPSGDSNVYGLDTSVRGILSPQFGGFGITLYAGPGYRFPSRGDSVPFGEAGLVLKVPGFAIGAGVKVFEYSWVDSSLPNDTELLLILSGGGSF